MLTKSQKGIAREIARTVEALFPTEQRLVLAYAAGLCDARGICCGVQKGGGKRPMTDLEKLCLIKGMTEAELIDYFRRELARMAREETEKTA